MGGGVGMGAGGGCVWQTLEEILKVLSRVRGAVVGYVETNLRFREEKLGLCHSGQQLFAI